MASKTTTAKLKENLKVAILETFMENSDTIKNLLGEVLEDLVLKNAIRKGVKSRKVSQQAVNTTLLRSK